MFGASRKFLFLSIMAVLLSSHVTFAKAPKKEAENELPDPLVVPYDRPIGFSVNLGSILSGTFEGRFHLGLVKNLTFVASPSFQMTPELPFYDPKNSGGSLSDHFKLFSFKRFHLGTGVRAHFYEYDSWDGWFIEGMGRFGMTWINKSDSVWSIIPSLMVGYAVVYDSGYSVSFGLGLEYEFLILDEDNTPPDVEAFRELYLGITKIPLMGEISVGWTW